MLGPTPQAGRTTASMPPTRRRARASSSDRPGAAGDERLLRFLVRAAQDLNSSLELEVVLAKIADRITRLIDCQLFCVLLWNERTRMLESRYSVCNGEPAKWEAGFPLGKGVSGHCARTRSPVRIADVREDPRYLRVRHPEVEVRSELAVPLLCQDRLVGVLDLESVEPDAFNEEHEQLVMALASHIAIALENARLYDRMVREDRRLQQDLATAAEVQKSLLSTAAPRVPGLDVGTAYLPAQSLGGDFFDFLPLPDRRLLIAIGDVAGKGAPAALYGSWAVGMLRGWIVERPWEPATMLERLNRVLFRPNLANRFVALTFGVFDPRDRSLRLANGGFTEPILMRRGVVERLPVRGLPVGLMPDARFREHRVLLEPGDVVAFVSDGLQEAINEQPRQFGEGFLEDVLRALEGVTARQVAEGLMRASTAYAGENERRPDDRSVVVLRVG